MGVRKHLAIYDGKATSILSELRQLRGDAPGFHAELVDCLNDPAPHIADGASWILKAELDEGRKIARPLIQPLLEALPGISHWQTQLHLCQILDVLDLTSQEGEAVMDWADGLRGHKRPFLRAWSLHLFVTLARRMPGRVADAKAALAEAEDDPAASVRARVRNLRKT